MESYQKRKRLLEEEYGKLIQVHLINDEALKKNENEKCVKQIADITDEEGLKLAYETKDDVYQHYNKLLIAGTKDFPTDHIDDLKLPFDDTLNKTHRGRTADAYYRSHHEMNTVIGHSLGGAVALSLEEQYKKEGNNPYGIVHSKTFGAPVVSGNIGSSFGKLGKTIVKDGILELGVAGGVAIGAPADYAIGFSDGGLLTGSGADIGKKISTDMANRLTKDNNTSPDRIRYFGDPISAMEFNAKTAMPSFKQRFNNSAHSYSGLQTAGKVQIHDTLKNPLTPPPDDNKAKIVTY